MTPQELRDKLSAWDDFESVLVLCDGELYDIKDLGHEDKSVVLLLNDS